MKFSKDLDEELQSSTQKDWDICEKLHAVAQPTMFAIAEVWRSILLSRDGRGMTHVATLLIVTANGALSNIPTGEP